MDIVRRRRKSTRAQVSRLCGELEKLITAASIDKTIIETKLEILSTHIDTLREDDALILEDLYKVQESEESELKIQKEIDDQEQYRTKYLMTKKRVIKVIAPNNEHHHNDNDNRSEAGSPSSFSRSYALPQVKVREFSGKLLDWLPYWSQFQSIHNDDTIPTAVKFTLLRQSVEKVPEAHQLLSDYAVTDANYETVVKLLQNRYGREDIQIQEHVRRLLSLQDPKNRNESFMKQWTTSEAYIRNLESLKVDGVESHTWLYLILEATVPEDILYQWQLSPDSQKDGSREDPPKTRLDYFREFVNRHLEARLNVELATMSLQDSKQGSKPVKTHQQQKKPVKNNDKLATAAGLFSGQANYGCIFCDGKHESSLCGKALKLNLEERKKKVNEKKVCFKCFKTGHQAKRCKAFAQCLICEGYHQSLLCPNKKPEPGGSTTIQENNQQGAPTPELNPGAPAFNPTPFTNSNNSSIQCRSDIVMKTLLVRASCHNSRESRIVRLLFDEGSQRSSVTSQLVRELRSHPVGHEEMREILANGQVTPFQKFNVHDIVLTGMDGRSITITARERKQIGGGIPRIPIGPWLLTLQERGINLTDRLNVPVERADVDICIGSDWEGLIKTGGKVDLGSGLAAWETILGWTLSGPTPKGSLGNTTINFFCGDQDASRLWNLEVLGISDPISRLSTEEEEKAALDVFNQTTVRDHEGRYVVNLPWKAPKSDLPNNFKIAEKRLQSTTKKLEFKNKYQEYNQLFEDWLKEGFIEEVQDDNKSGHYLPHHPVLKDSATTPVRPVFDANCKSLRTPSLNDCLYKGPNCIELLPSILMRFRQGPIGVVADIRKAFQMIQVKKEDRDFLKFLWWKEKGSKLRIFRHCRVVFGVNLSPFLLAAVLKLHLSSEEYDQDLCQKLSSSMYVDNLVTSVNTLQEAEDLRRNAIKIMMDAKMELRQWECNLGDGSGISQSTDEWCGLEPGKEITKVLGMLWDKDQDTLGLAIPPMETISDKITKRSLLSFISQIFDPLGLVSPATIVPKLVIQSAWRKKQGWDNELDEENVSKVLDWIQSVKCLNEIKIPRPHGLQDSSSSFQLHTFTDASQDAYACVVYLRSQDGENTSVQLLAAKSRVSPLQKDKSPTIPRLELMGCLIGSRMASAVKEALGFQDIKSFYWSDSTTALAWIKRNDNWGTFVGNRVKSILQVTDPDEWRHVPGVMNPADLPSRGCTPHELLQSRWWEGPAWLYREEEWPDSEDTQERKDEEVINSEKKKTQVALMSLVHEYPSRSISYIKNVKTVAWWQRFVDYKFRSKIPCSKYLSREEIVRAELGVIRLIQKELDLKSLGKKFEMIKGDDEIVRVKTAIINLKDERNFLFPILLPGKHELVKSLIQECHIIHCHAGTQFLMKTLREKYWITQTRRTITSVIHHCPTCQRYDSRNVKEETAPLPEKRVTSGEVFQTTGVDLAGPLFLRSGKKVWIVLFTCAVYRCVVLDIITSLDTVSFLQSLERFIAMFGRPTTIYSDNGTNFVGADNLFQELDWSKIEKESHVKKIQWTRNPPSAPWWGGFWERMVRSVKELLRRMLGKAKLSFEELRTVIQSVAAVINERPLTTVTEDPEDLAPLTPAMFMRGTRGTQFPEGAEITGSLLRGQYQRIQEIREALNARFRKEYLALLVRKPITRSSDLKLGQLVLVGMDNKKRYEWPLGRVIELIEGTDGKVRTVKVKTMGGIVTRPIQRLYPLELPEAPSSSFKEIKKTVGAISESEGENGHDDIVNTNVKYSRYGRKIKKPVRYAEWNY